MTHGNPTLNKITLKFMPANFNYWKFTDASTFELTSNSALTYKIAEYSHSLQNKIFYMIKTINYLPPTSRYIGMYSPCGQSYK